MRTSTLTPSEQEKLYQAVQAHQDGIWKSRADSILASFCEDAALVIDFLRGKAKMPANQKYIDRAVEFKEQYAKMKREYLQLKKRKLIIVSRKQDAVLAKLTDKGYLRLARRMLKENRKKFPGDEQLFVTFDVPEDASHARSSFRRFLKTSDFKMLQKSVWMTEFDVRVPMRMIVKELKIEKWVSVIVGSIQKE